VSGLATLISLVIGLGVAIPVALNEFPGKRLVIALLNTGMGLPPVVVGLFVTVLLWRNGPFGFLEILYTPTAMILAQAVIASPIIAGISLSALQHLPPGLRLQILALGASRPQMVWLLLKEARLPLLAAVMAGFGGVISEVGASIMVGGNIKGQTRVLTTATVMETSKGNFEVAFALSILLLVLAFAVNAVLTHVQQRNHPR
jgi:tungstate transport system permease protein